MEPPTDLSCQELVELVTDYLEGMMTPEDRMRFDDHLGICTGCRCYLVQMRQTLTLAGNLPAETISAEALDTFLRTFRDWKRNK
ncbi:MAG TPA: zf-HC2 domain-containing protein [Ktedonobacterales bacterium]|nr:zf-HC2 domain-containing protein [Ktedonobacterales bacterium]